MIHNEFTQENPRIIDRTDRSRSKDLLTPRRSLNSALPLQIQKQYTARGSSWGLLSLSLTTKGSWINLWGRVAKPLVSSLTEISVVHGTGTSSH